ncbi:hypothetical protein HLRTI_002856 [Halorhabdus tiamatea SARL4B]|uniref:Conserved hypothetical membrane protein n=1 Tax=Halorhabdus tiamatea SARL4B TaxID=1033806 RepID=F7PFR3_9EURY|nr:hypothetical protein [Halorhabdus tiamatea]ERJ05133.1 hypothetical protein HLRTI_002856 [Halorhabdus tiamatea SARL4B]CCQ32279.1 conserved hypothetical membrane protein [Halorhabdus tiamatea SARL4B]
MSQLVWLLDRGAGLVAYPALYLAVLTGIFYNTEAFGVLHTAARRVHIEISVFAMLVTLLHAGLGLLDAWFVLSGEAPAPAYSLSYFLGGVVVGVGALLMLVVAVLGFTDAKRFDDPWGPRVVHSFAYGGFGFGTIHVAAIGTDIAGLIVPVLAPSMMFLAYVLLLRLFVLRRSERASPASQ